jgi:hypothetical protein
MNKITNVIESLFYWFLKNIKILILVLFFLALECLIFLLCKSLNVDLNIIAASMTSIGIIFGYFVTHYLEIMRAREKDNFAQHCELLQALRIFISETDLDENETKDLVNKFQQAYFGSTVFISRAAYGKLKNVAKLFSVFQATKEKSQKEKDAALNEFRSAQSDFINCLRREFFNNREIDFVGYDIRWKDKYKE